MRNKSTQPAAVQEVCQPNDGSSAVETSSQQSQHVELFADFEDKMKKVKPMDEEKRLEQEKYEKQIGYLTYLGQDTHEALGTRNWYDVAPKRDDSLDESSEQVEVGLKTKHLHDPMRRFVGKSVFSKDSVSTELTSEDKSKLSYQSILVSRKRSRTPEKSHSDHKKSKHRKRSKSPKSPRKKKKSKKSKKHKRKRTSSGDDCDEDGQARKKAKMDILQKLREQRLQREKEEQHRTTEYIKEKFPSLVPPEKKRVETKEPEFKGPVMKRKYNSQFNPFLAKQNYM